MFRRNPVDSLENRDPAVIDRITAIVGKTLWPYHRAEVRGLERVPAQGGLIYVGNHNGYPYMTEGWLLTTALYRAFGMARFPYFLMHPVSLGLPLLNPLFAAYGGVRAAPRNAVKIVRAGHPMLVYPGAEAELMRPYRERTRLRFGGQTSHVRLALRFDAAIVPVAAVGGHSTALILDDLPWLAELLGVKRRLNIGAWPLMLSFPWGLTLGPFIPPYVPWPAKILVELLEPIRFSRTGPDAARDVDWVDECAAQVERVLEEALARLEAERREQHGLVRCALDTVTSGLGRWLAPDGEDRSKPGRPLRVDDIGSRLAAIPGASTTDARSKVASERRAKAASPRRRAAAGETSAAGRRTKAASGRRGRSRHTPAEIAAILAQGRTCESVEALCRRWRISTSTYYRWRRASRSRPTAPAPPVMSPAALRRAFARARRGERVVDLCHELGISRTTYYRWRARLDA